MRVMLADDSTLLREGLARLLAEEGHEVTAAVGDAEGLLAAVAAAPPDAVVVDVRMPPRHTDEGLRADDPGAALPRPGAGRRLPKVLSVADVDRLFDAITTRQARVPPDPRDLARRAAAVLERYPR